MSKIEKTSNPYYYKEVAKKLGVRHLFGRWGFTVFSGIKEEGRGVFNPKLVPLDGWIFEPKEIENAIRQDDVFVVRTERQQLKQDILEAIAALEVKSLPSDDPELRYWQGYADAQLKITEEVEKL